jgi:hypothetical protein
MAATSSTTHTHESATRSIAASRESTGSAAARDASPEAAATEGGSDTLQTLSRVIYSGAYALAYGVVYATVFVAQSLPQENPVMHGFRDGGRAAMDELSQSP